MKKNLLIILINYVYLFSQDLGTFCFDFSNQNEMNAQQAEIVSVTDIHRQLSIHTLDEWSGCADYSLKKTIEINFDTFSAVSFGFDSCIDCQPLKNDSIKVSIPKTLSVINLDRLDKEAFLKLSGAEFNGLLSIEFICNGESLGSQIVQISIELSGQCMN